MRTHPINNLVRVIFVVSIVLAFVKSDVLGQSSEDVEIRKAIQVHIGGILNFTPPGQNPFMVASLQISDHWALYNMVSFPITPAPDPDLTVPDVKLGLARQQADGEWQVAFEQEAAFADWFLLVPDDLLSAESKRMLAPSSENHLPKMTDGTYKIPGLPWALNTSWKFSQGPHYGTQGAIDFATPDGQPGTVRAAESGVVIYSTETCMGVRRSGDNLRVWYQHIRTSDIATWTVGRSVTLGTTIGLTTTVPGCDGESTGHHVHMYFDLGVNLPATYVGSSYNGWEILGGSDLGKLRKCGTTLTPVASILYSNVTCDSTPPVTTAALSGANLTNGWYNAPVMVTLNASDSGGSGLNHTAYDIDWVNPGSTRSWPYSFVYGQDGAHTLYYRSADNAGNVETLNSLPFYIDQVPPSAPTSASPGCTTTNNVWQNTCADPNFTWSGASDGTSGVAGYQYYWGTSSTGTTTEWLSGAAYNPPAVSAGTYYLRVRTGDWAGNFSGWETLFILRYDDLAPSMVGEVTNDCGLVSDGPWQNYCQQPLMTWEAADTDSGVKGYYLYWGSVINGTSTNLVTKNSYKPISIDSRIYFLRLKLVDQAGNESPWTTQFILRTDQTVPFGRIKINQGAVNTISRNVVLFLEAQDDRSGVDKIRLANEGGLWTEWQDYTAQVNWQLPDGYNTTHTVLYEVRDIAGNVRQVKDSIYLGEMDHFFLPVVQR